MTRIRRMSDEVREDLAHKSYVKKCLRLILHDMLAKPSCTAVVNNDCCMSSDESIRYPRRCKAFRKLQKRLRPMLLSSSFAWPALFSIQVKAVRNERVVWKKRYPTFLGYHNGINQASRDIWVRLRLYCEILMNKRRKKSH